MLVDGHNLLWSATFGFPAPIYSRDKTRLFTGLFAFFALLRVAICDDIPGAAPEIIVVFDGEHGTEGRQQIHKDYKASRPADDQARLPLTFLPDVKRGLEHCGIAWIELEHAEADDVIATVVHATPAPCPVIILSRDLVTPDEVYRRHQVTPHSGLITGRWPGTPPMRSRESTASGRRPDPR
jgi:5'-3' exonuclease